MLNLSEEPLAAILDHPGNVGISSSVLATNLVSVVRPHSLLGRYEELKLRLPFLSQFAISLHRLVLENVVQNIVKDNLRDSCLSHVSPIQAVETIRSHDTLLRLHGAHMAVVSVEPHLF